MDEALALHAGPQAKRTPFAPRKRHGELEKQYLNEVIDSDTLFYYFGTKVFELQKKFAEMYGRRYGIACSSGTAAVHIALGALELPPGSEVITSPITDMGTVTGMLYQGLIPVFADVDAETLNMDPRSVAQRITNRTRAIVAVHHAGLAVDVEALAALGLPVIEDCAQAFGCEYKGRLAGTFTPISTFSLNHFKHITCGSGGMVLTDDERLRYLATLFADKCYQREEGIRNPYFLAPNYQMTELQGAVALAQLRCVGEIAAARNRLGGRLSALLERIPGITPQAVPAGCKHSYFLYLFRLEREVLGCTVEEFSEALAAEGIPNDARTITGGRPVYLYDVFQKRSAFPGSDYPFSLTDRIYRPGDCPVAEAAFDSWITMNVYETYTDTDLEEIAAGVQKVAQYFAVRNLWTRTVSAGVAV
ncbi:MAG TPA: DegT/DnrJ/EryC1/StrS family aminotransferase [Bryobacteraceae bacterium]|nr:DegT/DnrJ/EryC1/StrS family aminotransferase [Bryobacteraceae bacterium]